MKCVTVGSFVALAGSLGLAVVLNAQPPAQSSSRPPDTYDPSKTHVVTGCLKPAQKEGDFVLADAVDGKAGATKATYALIGVVPPGVRLKNHLNHKVEISGSIGETSTQAGKTLNMEAFKMVAEKC